jgi:hypothetical protein
MESPTPVVVRDGEKSKSLVGFLAALSLHTVIVYESAIHLSPWSVYHWFGWVAPALQTPIDMPATDWYLQHLEIVTITPALILGYFNVTRFFPPTIRSYIRERPSVSVAVWAWAVPTAVLGYKMLLYHAPSSVLYHSSMSAIKYFFDIQKVMPTASDFRGSDPIQVLAQMTVTAPFYAGVAYTLGALASKNQLLTRFFTFEKHGEPLRPPDP